ncbi:MAG: hypothetical protein EXQ63_01700 [Ilumatobacteraceae bacterium]|nr:hypothetical protein [Ilumatobacteraceae bacterium]
MPVFLVRHAKAGSRSGWDGSDFDRPLSIAGMQQSQLLVETFSIYSPPAVYSSPYLRCIQTVGPIAAYCGLIVRTDNRLAEGANFEDTVAFINNVDDNSVLCSHGDVIPAAVQALIRRGLEMTTPPDSRKAGVYVLHKDYGRFVSAECFAPPKILAS